VTVFVSILRTIEDDEDKMTPHSPFVKPRSASPSIARVLRSGPVNQN